MNRTVGAELLRDAHRAQRSEARAKVRTLRAAAKKAHGATRDAFKEARSFCARARAAVRTRSAKERHAELSRVMRDEKRAARTACDAQKTRARALADLTARVRAERDAERRYQAELRRIEAGSRRRVVARRRATGAERSSESDDAVRQAIPAELVPLFERVKRAIKPSVRASRAEVFLEYAEEHPAEIFAALEMKTERMLRERAAAERRRQNPATDGAREYARTHWGERGTGRASRTGAPDPRVEPLVELGELVEIVYRTKKGGDVVRMDYEHAFESPRPRLAYNATGLVVVGGGYHVSARGIVR